jgi:hypothetical protein
MKRIVGLGLLLVLAACDEREAVWDTMVPNPPVAFGMNDAVALVDAPANRVMMLPVGAELELAPASIPIGAGFAAAAMTPDRQQLLALSRGVVPRRTGEDEGPSLSLIAASPEPQLLDRYEMGDPLSRLAVDPESRFAVAFPSSDDGTFVHNPNELVVFDLSRPPAGDNPTALTLRSFGGRPERLTFTPVLGLPGGARRLLLVESDRDVSILDLDHLDIPEVTIQLTSGPDPLAPASIAFSDGAPERDDDTRIAIRIANDPNVILVDLLPPIADDPDKPPQSYRALPNVVFVGGTATDIAFVQTDAGLRLAALVPSTQSLTLVDPPTGIATEVELGAPFERMSLVTSIVGAGADGSDVALLWSTSSPEIAFVALGSTVDKPYKSIERTELSEPVVTVLEVPSPNQHLKILGTAGGADLFVLDVVERTAAPIESSMPGTRVTVASGERAWINAAGPQLARLDLGSLHPENLVLNRPIDSVFEVAQRDGGRALIALHTQGSTGATVLDAQNPSLTNAREYHALLLGDLR